MAVTTLKTEQFNITFKSKDNGYFWGDTPLTTGEYCVNMMFCSGTLPEDIIEELESIGAYDVVITPLPEPTIIY